MGGPVGIRGGVELRGGAPGTLGGIAETVACAEEDRQEATLSLFGGVGAVVLVAHPITTEPIAGARETARVRIRRAGVDIGVDAKLARTGCAGAGSEAEAKQKETSGNVAGHG